MRTKKKEFRTIRAKLPPEAFAVHPDGPPPPPRDLIEPHVWQEVISLPDDVALRTSDDYGTEIKAMLELWGSVIEMCSETGDAWFRTCLYMADGLQACTFNALCGYYGVGASSLRGTMEALIAGVFFQLEETEQAAVRWQNGDYDIKFGSACDRLMGNARMAGLESHLHSRMKYSIFNQKTSNVDPGWARFLYSELSDYSHSRPTHSEGALWEGSNGPVFVPKSFGRVYAYYVSVCALLYVLVKICRPYMKLPEATKWLFKSKHVTPAQVAVESFEYVWGASPSGTMQST
jgi:hypothetical protein